MAIISNKNNIGKAEATVIFPRLTTMDADFIGFISHENLVDHICE